MVGEDEKLAVVVRPAAPNQLPARDRGKMPSVFWTQGAYDLIAITDWPDEDSAMAFLLQLGMAGNVTTETLRAYDETEMQRILAKL